jgi:transposase
MAEKKRRRLYTPEFKAEAVRLARLGDRSVREAADALGLAEQVLRRWMEAIPKPGAPTDHAAPDLNAAEKQELTQLRKEVVRLRQERDILKAAATFFAKESE